MKFFQKFYEVISRGEPADPDEPIELIVVPAASGPMTLARLREDGFDATGHENFNVATETTNHFRILVPRREFERASERLKGIL